MTDLYRIRIDACVAGEVTATIALNDPQASDLPAKSNVALQVLTDSFRHIREFPDEVRPDCSGYGQLAPRAQVELERLDGLLREGAYARYVSEAAEQVLLVEQAGEAGWDAVDAWESELLAGVAPDETETPAPSITLRLRVRDPELTGHLVPGLTWTTPIWDRTEG